MKRPFRRLSDDIAGKGRWQTDGFQRVDEVSVRKKTRAVLFNHLDILDGEPRLAFHSSAVLVRRFRIPGINVYHEHQVLFHAIRYLHSLGYIGNPTCDTAHRDTLSAVKMDPNLLTDKMIHEKLLLEDVLSRFPFVDVIMLWGKECDLFSPRIVTKTKTAAE